MSQEVATVRGAVARQEAATGPEPLAVVVRKAIEQQTTAMRAVLPKDHDPERFGRLVLTAVKAAPELMNCFTTDQGRTSVLLAAMQLATVGLEPNTALQEAWLLPRKNKGIWECQASYGYRGLLKLARRSGEIKTVFAGVVRENDDFHFARGIEADEFRHVEAENDRGEITHAYAIVRYVNGGNDFVVLNWAQLAARRAMSDSWKNESARPYSPWTKWPEEQCKKTALRVLSKTMPMSADVARAVENDERPLAVDDGVIVATLIDPETPELEPAP